MQRKALSILFILVLPLALQSQNFQLPAISDVIIKTGSGSFNLADHTINYMDLPHLYFYYQNIDEIAEVELEVEGVNPGDSSYSVLPSGDFEIINQFASFRPNQLVAKIRFTNLSNNNFLKLVVSKKEQDTLLLKEIPLLPLTHTAVNFFPQSDELFLGEEKVFELVSNNPENIAIHTDWVRDEHFMYRVDRRFDELQLHIVPGSYGMRTLTLKLQTRNPQLDSTGNLSYDLPPIEKEFNIRRSRLAFLNSYTREITFSEQNRKEGIEIQLDDSPRLVTGRTYRIENQEEPGGALIAEIFTKSRLSNNRMLCLARVYNMHKSSDGYLYIKDLDQAINLTNIDITPELKINRIQLMKEGETWSSDLSVFPGEIVQVKIEGQGLLKSAFAWNNAVDITSDSTLKTDNVEFFRLKIPTNINTKRIALFNRGEDTGKGLNLKEYKIPRNFDFVALNYGDGDITLTSISGPVIHKKVIKDILVDFDFNKIDSENKLYGIQYIEIEVRITGKNRELIEMKTIPVFGVCPGELSPRHPYYYSKDCINSAISLNKYLSRKTYDLDDWVRIQLTFKHDKSKYEEPGMTQTVELIVQKDFSFDIDVSFPAGLIIKTFNDETNAGAFDNFGGISMAMMAQFSFYDHERIGKYKPYKIGAGFLALNAFNFNDNVSRDVALVVLGSLYPTRKDSKLTFPLYMGGGIWLGTGKPFVLLGPGIRISL